MPISLCIFKCVVCIGTFENAMTQDQFEAQFLEHKDRATFYDSLYFKKELGE